MPIRPEHRWLYPIDWPELSALVRFKRAGGRCEGCGRPHGHLVWHLSDGRWSDPQDGLWRDGEGRPQRRARVSLEVLEAAWTSRVVLAATHRDHDPTNNRIGNLAALCQRCHLVQDRPEHRRRRRLTFRRRKAVGDFFDGP